MLVSSLTWANKKYTTKELTNGAVTVVLPAVVKVTQVPDAYVKSCPKMSVNTVYFIHGYGKEQRVAFKTTDNKHFFSFPLDSPIKFRKVFLHDKGPAILLKNLLAGKVEAELNVEIYGNEGNRLSSTPDMSNVVRYGTFQVVGLYTDTVLHAQAILNESGELSPKMRNVSFNCPAKFDVANGFLKRSKEEFKQFQIKLKLTRNQSTKTTDDQNESLTDLVLMSAPTRANKEMQYLEHLGHLYNGVSNETKLPSREEKADEGTTSIKDALEKLKKSSKQENIPQVDKSRMSVFLPSNGHTAKPKGTPDVIVYDDATSNLNAKQTTELNGKNSVDKTDYENSLERQKLSSQDLSSKTAFKGSQPSGSSGEMSGTYLNKAEIDPATNVDSDSQLLYECLDLPQDTPQQSPSMSLNTGDYLNGRKLQLLSEENQSSKSSLANKQPQDGSVVKCTYGGTEYDTDINPGNNNLQIRSTDRLVMPLPAPPPPQPRSKDRKQRFSMFSRSKPDKKIVPRIKPTVPEEAEIYDDYEEPVEEQKNSFEPMSKNASGECKWKSASQVPKNIKKFTVNDVTFCLQLLNMERYVSKFRERNVDGAFLMKINKKMLMESFQMQELEAKQLIEFAIKKWRPKK